MIRVLVVEDSPTTRELLVRILGSDKDVHVVATACDGEEALAAVHRYHPDVITMDINMPRMNGLEATRRIMETRPTPIVIVSAAVQSEATASFNALEAGALAVMPRPVGLGHKNFEQASRDLVRSIRLMSEVKVVKRWSRTRPVAPGPTWSWPGSRSRVSPVEILAIGGSTGAPAALETILRRLPKPYPIPILVVQHMAPGFIGGFAEWLASVCSCGVALASHGMSPQNGGVYLAPDGQHLGLDSSGLVHLSSAPPEHGLRPSVSYLFRSVTQAYGGRAAAVLLSGMGVDGAAALKTLREAGALTIAQDEESSVVHGMPGEAVKLGAPAMVLPPAEIARVLADPALFERIPSQARSGEGR